MTTKEKVLYQHYSVLSFQEKQHQKALSLNYLFVASERAPTVQVITTLLCFRTQLKQASNIPVQHSFTRNKSLTLGTYSKHINYSKFTFRPISCNTQFFMGLCCMNTWGALLCCIYYTYAIVIMNIPSMLHAHQ